MVLRRHAMATKFFMGLTFSTLSVPAAFGQENSPGKNVVESVGAASSLENIKIKVRQIASTVAKEKDAQDPASIAKAALSLQNTLREQIDKAKDGGIEEAGQEGKVTVAVNMGAQPMTHQPGNGLNGAGNPNKPQNIKGSGETYSF